MPGSTEAVVEPILNVRVIADGWWSGNDNNHPVSLGEVLSYPLSVAHDLRHLGRVEIVRKVRAVTADFKHTVFAPTPNPDNLSPPPPPTVTKVPVEIGEEVYVAEDAAAALVAAGRAEFV
jgi:hypothetical protein